MSKKFYVYLHRFSNGTLYVGKGSGRRMNASSGRNSWWSRLHAKYGEPVRRKIYCCVDEREALKTEKAIISKLKSKGRTLCNLTDGDGGVSGFKVPRSQKIAYCINNGRDKFELQRIDGGPIIYGYQFKLSEITGIDSANISSLCTGKLKSCSGWRLASTDPSDVGNKGKRHPMYGKKHSKSTLDKLRKASAGSNNAGYASKKHIFINDELNILEFCTQNDLNKNYDLGHSGVSMLAGGKIKRFKGWRLHTTDKMFYRNRGSNNHNHNSTKYVFAHKTVCIVERSTQYAFRSKYGFNHSVISAICRGRRKSHKGWVCLGAS